MAIEAYAAMVAMVAEADPIKQVMMAAWMTGMLKALVNWGVTSQEEMERIVTSIGDEARTRMEDERESLSGVLPTDEIFRLGGI